MYIASTQWFFIYWFQWFQIELCEGEAGRLIEKLLDQGCENDQQTWTTTQICPLVLYLNLVHNDSRAKEYNWTMNCVNVILSEPIKPFHHCKRLSARTWNWRKNCHEDFQLRSQTDSFPGTQQQCNTACLDRGQCKAAQLLFMQFQNHVASEGMTTI